MLFNDVLFNNKNQKGAITIEFVQDIHVASFWFSMEHLN